MKYLGLPFSDKQTEKLSLFYTCTAREDPKEARSLTMKATLFERLGR